jgi:hypothetical protein
MIDETLSKYSSTASITGYPCKIRQVIAEISLPISPHFSEMLLTPPCCRRTSELKRRTLRRRAEITRRLLGSGRLFSVVISRTTVKNSEWLLTLDAL